LLAIFTFHLEEDTMRLSLLSVSGSVVAIASALAVSSCGGSSNSSLSPTMPTPSGANVVVNIGSSAGSSAYNPNPVPASAGQTVAFKNNDARTHHIVMDDGSADFGDLPFGVTSRTITATASGGKFHCTIHSSMVGAINGPIPDPPPCMGGYCD
jgi:plastocyanin